MVKADDRGGRSGAPRLRSLLLGVLAVAALGVVVVAFRTKPDWPPTSRVYAYAPPGATVGDRTPILLERISYRAGAGAEFAFPPPAGMTRF